ARTCRDWRLWKQQPRRGILLRVYRGARGPSVRWDLRFALCRFATVSIVRGNARRRGRSHFVLLALYGWVVGVSLGAHLPRKIIGLVALTEMMLSCSKYKEAVLSLLAS